MNKEWFVFKNTHHLGPFSEIEIAEFYKNKEIYSESLIWKEGNAKWEPLKKIENFKHLIEVKNPASSKKRFIWRWPS